MTPTDWKAWIAPAGPRTMLRPTLTKCCGESSARGYSVDRLTGPQRNITPHQPAPVSCVSRALVHQSRLQLMQSTLSSLLQQGCAHAGMEQQWTALSGRRATCGSSQAATSMAAQLHCLAFSITVCTRARVRPAAFGYKASISTCARLPGSATNEQGRMAPIAAAMRRVWRPLDMRCTPGRPHAAARHLWSAWPCRPCQERRTYGISHGQACWQRSSGCCRQQWLWPT